MLKSDKIKKIEKDIRNVIESEGLHCPKFFITHCEGILKFHVHAYEENAEKVWAERFKEIYPELSEQILKKWVKMGDTDLEILGIDSSMPHDNYMRAKDRHGNEFLIRTEDLLENNDHRPQ